MSVPANGWPAESHEEMGPADTVLSAVQFGLVGGAMVMVGGALLIPGLRLWGASMAAAMVAAAVALEAVRRRLP